MALELLLCCLAFVYPDKVSRSQYEEKVGLGTRDAGKPCKDRELVVAEAELKKAASDVVVGWLVTVRRSQARRRPRALPREHHGDLSADDDVTLHIWYFAVTQLFFKAWPRRC